MVVLTTTYDIWYVIPQEGNKLSPHRAVSRYCSFEEENSNDY